MFTIREILLSWSMWFSSATSVSSCAYGIGTSDTPRSSADFRRSSTVNPRPRAPTPLPWAPPIIQARSFTFLSSISATSGRHFCANRALTGGRLAAERTRARARLERVFAQRTGNDLDFRACHRGFRSLKAGEYSNLLIKLGDTAHGARSSIRERGGTSGTRGFSGRNDTKGLLSSDFVWSSSTEDGRHASG